MTVTFFAPCANILTYLLIYLFDLVNAEPTIPRVGLQLDDAVAS